MTGIAERVAQLSPEQRTALLERLKEQRSGGTRPAGTRGGIVAAERTGDTVALSFTQERIWFLEQFDPGTALHNMSGVARLRLQVEPNVFADCLHQVVQRHEILRTRYMMRDGEPVGVVAGHMDVPVRVLTGISTQEREQLFLEDARTPFDVSAGPLLRVTVAPVDENECFIQLTMHHMVSDGFSTAVFFRELGELYPPRLAGVRIDLPALPFQFSDVAAAEHQALIDETLAGSLDYWTGHLDGAPQQLALPADHRRPARMTRRGRRLPVEIPPDLTEQVTRLSRNRSVTPFVTMLAAFATVLGRYAAQDDLIIGVPVANRDLPGVDRLIGPFLNTLALRFNLTDSPTFGEFVAQVNETVRTGFEHQTVPFERVLQAVHGVRDPSRSPLFQAAFNFQIDQSTTSGSPVAELRDLPNGGCHFDLLFDLMTTPAGIKAHIDYYADVYDEATIAQLADSFLAVLRAGIRDVEQPVDTLALLSPQAADALIEEGQRTGRAYDSTQYVHELVLEAVRRHPDRTALIDGGRLVTYSEVDARSAALAAELSGQVPTAPGAHVALCLPRSADMIIAILGVLRAGLSYVPIDPGYPAERIAFIFADADVAAIITRDGLRSVLPTQDVPVIVVDRPMSASIITPRVPDAVRPDDPERSGRRAYTIYTSGSTGVPKGVQVSHRNIVNMLTSVRDRPGIAETDVLLAVTSPSFDIAIVDMLLPLLVGARVVVAAPDDVLDGRRLASLIDKHRVTLMQATPATWYLLVGSGWRGSPGMRVWSAGEALAPALAAELLSRCAELWNGYGPTETSVYSTFHLVDAHDVSTGCIPIGRAIANVTTYVLDHGRNPVPRNVVGELYHGGDGVSIGYLGHPELTAAAFLQAPFAPAQRLYRTGDLVRLRPDGELEFAGRADHQVKIRGHRIELGEIEAILGSHPSIAKAVAVVREGADRDASIVAYVEASRSVAESVSTAELKALLRRHVPEYMVPARLVQLAELPLTPNGKIDRAALHGVDRGPDPDSELPASAGYVAPRNETEERMAAVWRDLLDKPRVGVLDGFFDLGGHSLLATKLVFRIREVFGIDVPLQALFDGEPTIARLSALLTDGAAAAEGLEVDLVAEAQLGEDIRPDTGAHVHSVRYPQHIFLTGATGFVGAFLLARLLTTTEAMVFCLVRATSDQDGQERIRTALTEYGVWDPALSERIVPVVGTLSRPRLGVGTPQWQHLAATVDVIYHCGAEVNFLQPYATLKPPNVLGTAEVLRLACDGTTKPVHFISTTYVFSRFSYPSGTDFTETEDPIHDPKTSFGYTQTKWVSEQFVLEAGRRGLPVYVYRAGRVAGDSTTGACQTYDFVWQIIKVGIQMGAAPIIDMSLDMTPVDYVVSALVHLSRQPDLQGLAFHLVAEHPVREPEFVAWLEGYGYGGERVTFVEWCRRVVERAADLSDETAGSLAPFLTGTLPLDRFPAGGFDQRNVERGLAGSGITCPPIDDRLLRAYFGYFRKIGYLPAPRDPETIGDRS